MLIYYWLIAILPLVNHPIWGAEFGPLTVFEYLGILSLGYAIFRTFGKRNLSALFGSWETKLFILLYVIASVSTLFRPGGIAATNGAFTIYTSSLFLILITICVVDSVDRLRWTILVIIGSYAWASLYVIREWEYLRAAGINARPGWIVGDSNYFATASVYAIALALHFMRGERPRMERLFCFACLPVIMFANTACASRGGFLGLAVACVLLVWQGKNRIRNLLLVSAIVLPLSLLMPVSPLHRLLESNKYDYGSTDAHLDAWWAGLHMIKDHPLFGVGVGHFKGLMPLYAAPGVKIDSLAHNMFIEVAAEMGLPAEVIFVSIFACAFFSLGKICKDTTVPAMVHDAAVALRAGLVGSAIAGCFVSAEYQKTTWMGFALVACLTPLARSLKSGEMAALRATAPWKAVQSVSKPWDLSPTAPRSKGISWVTRK